MSSSRTSVNQKAPVQRLRHGMSILTTVIMAGLSAAQNGAFVIVKILRIHGLHGLLEMAQ